MHNVLYTIAAFWLLVTSFITIPTAVTLSHLTTEPFLWTFAKVNWSLALQVFGL